MLKLYYSLKIRTVLLHWTGGLYRSKALEPNTSFFFFTPGMYDGSSASHNGLNFLNTTTTTNSVTAVAPLTVPPHDCIGVSIAPSATVGTESEKGTNIFS